MRPAIFFALIAALPLLLVQSISALATADGPDAWQVTGVTPGDTLNVRMGPGTDYPVIGTLAHNASGLEAITCTPYMTFAIFERLSQAQRDGLPPRWCLVLERASGTQGWVSGKFLAEDAGTPVAETDDPQAVEAVSLVTELMQAIKAQEAGGPSPLQMPLARRFFFADMIPNIDPARLGADPVVGGQDAMLSDIVVGLDPDQPPLRGMYTVRAAFANFGQPRTVTFYLRVDISIAPEMRILQFDADGVEYR